MAASNEEGLIANYLNTVERLVARWSVVSSDNTSTFIQLFN
jgi:hypothetical protein